MSSYYSSFFFLLQHLEHNWPSINFGGKEGKKEERTKLPEVTAASFSSSECLFPFLSNYRPLHFLLLALHTLILFSIHQFLPLDYNELTNVR